MNEFHQFNGNACDNLSDYPLSQQLDDYQSVMGLSADDKTKHRIKALLDDPQSNLRLLVESVSANARGMLGGSDEDIPEDSWEVARALAEREARGSSSDQRVAEIHGLLYGIGE